MGVTTNYQQMMMIRLCIIVIISCFCHYLLNFAETLHRRSSTNIDSAAALP